MAADDRGLWVVCEESGAVVLIDPAKNRAGPPIGVGLEPRFVTVAFGSVWVSNHLDSTIARIDPAGKVPTGIPTEFGPQVMAEADGGLWVSSVHSDSVQRIDPESDEPGPPIETEPFPDGLVFHDRSLWIAPDLVRSCNGWIPPPVR